MCFWLILFFNWHPSNIRCSISKSHKPLIYHTLIYSDSGNAVYSRWSFAQIILYSTTTPSLIMIFYMLQNNEYLFFIESSFQIKRISLTEALGSLNKIIFIPQINSITIKLVSSLFGGDFLKSTILLLNETFIYQYFSLLSEVQFFKLIVIKPSQTSPVKGELSFFWTIFVSVYNDICLKPTTWCFVVNFQWTCWFMFLTWGPKDHRRNSILYLLWNIGSWIFINF